MKKVIVVAVLFAAAALHAQNPVATQQADAWRFHQQLSTQDADTSAAPEFYGGETADVGPQSLLQLKPRRHWLAASADEQLFYTDNVFLADKKAQSANILVSTVEVALAPTDIEVDDGQLAPRLGYQHQWFNYGVLGSDDVLTASFNPAVIATNSLSRFDFNVQTIFADTAWSRGGWEFSFGVDYRRFLDSGDYEEFYREIVPRLAARYTFQLAENKSITFGYEGDFRATRTSNPILRNGGSYNDRTDQSLVLVGNWQLCAHASLQPFYRLQYSYFTSHNPGRTDWQNTFGLVVNVPLTSNVALRVFTSYETLTTDGAFVLNYEKFDIGGGLNLSVRF
jgi:hypothetical protein